MLNINFVPDDYVQNSESRRTNLMYLVLFAVVMAALGGSFATIKIRQRALATKERLVNSKLARAQEAIEQFEALQIKRKEMMKTALTTAELIETVPRSVLLAALTNNLPSGVSLLRLSLVQKELKERAVVTTSKYQKAQAGKEGEKKSFVSPEKLLETNIGIEGVAPSDRQVASYIQSLSTSTLLENVALVESKEHKVKDASLRRFRLTAKLRKEIHLTKEDVERIRLKTSSSAPFF
ncbi:MAG: PilN domain-containing protein [Planctomycetota bacterium]|jgi:Tfp pilus assembly protein PilN